LRRHRGGACAPRELLRLAACQKHWSAPILAGALVCPPDLALTDVSRRYFPSCASSASSSVAALASAPMTRAMHGSPRRVTGPPRYRLHPINADRSASASLEVPLLPFGVRRSRRTARSNRLRTIPLRRCSQPRHPRQEVGSPVRFLAPRVSVAFQLRAWETPSARVIRGRFLSTDVPDPRPGLFSRPGRDRQSPGDAHGIH
jgi:hypothetical protein